MNYSSVVFHVTTPDRANKCLAEGIFPGKTSQSSDRTQQIDLEFDAERPEHILKLGVSRRESVYAHPDINHALKRKNGGWLNRLGVEVEMLAINIPDATKVFVADGLLNAEPYSPSEYWASLTTLADYESQANPTFLAPRQYGGQRLTRYVYMWPEVLLPGVVAPEQISRSA